MNDSRSAVKNDEGAASGSLEVPDDLVPCLAGLADTGHVELGFAFHGVQVRERWLRAKNV